MSYVQLSGREREVIGRGLAVGLGVRALAERLGRSASTISREVRRNRGAEGYWADSADARARQRRCRPRRHRKLSAPGDNGLVQAVRAKLRRYWSPEQIACWLKRTYPDRRERWVSHQTIYAALHILPRGELKRELLACLRREGKARRAGEATPVHRPWVHQLIDDRPAEARTRQVPGHWEGDLLIGQAAGTAAVGVLLERTTRRISLVKLDRRDAYSAYRGFAHKLQGIAPSLRKTLAYDQGTEMADHARLTDKIGIAVYFCDPHSPWQRAGCENTNGLLRQYLPKGMDFAPLTQTRLDQIAWQMNARPRKTLNWATPEEVWQAILNNQSVGQAVALGT